MKKLTALFALVLMLILNSTISFANDKSSIFLQHELNDSDSITGIGISGNLGLGHSYFEVHSIASLNIATVMDTYGYQNDYLGLDLGFRFGYFNDIFLYVEGGVDVFEGIIEYDRHNTIDYPSPYDDGNTLDAYAAFGAGIQAGKIRVEGFVKTRNIDSDGWEAHKRIFYGMKFSLAF